MVFTRNSSRKFSDFLFTTNTNTSAHTGTHNTLPTPTFVAIPDGVEIDVVIHIVEEKGEPGIEGIDGHEQQDPHYPSLFCRIAVVSQVLVNLPGGRWKVE